MKLSVLSLALTCFSCGLSPAYAELQALTEDSMEAVTGEGVAILPENMRIIFDPLAYIRTIPRGAPVNSSGGSYTDRAGDLYWYGFAFTGSNGSVTALPTSATTSITSWGTYSNPWVFRATSTTDLLYNGTTPSNAYPVLQYSAPRYTAAADFTDNTVMNLKYAFVGDLVICGTGTPNYGSTATCGGLAKTTRLLNLDVWDGFSFHGSKYNIFQSTVDYTKYMGGSSTTPEGFTAVSTGAAATGTFGAVWLNRINSDTTGVLRFAVGSNVADNTTLSYPLSSMPTFNQYEGVYLTDLDINMPIGHLHYQPLIFDNDSSGNLIIELVRIPKTANVINYAYANYGYSGVDPTSANVTSGTGYTDSAFPYNPAPNSSSKICSNSMTDCSDATHGQVRWAQTYFRDNSGAYVVPRSDSGGTYSALGSGGCTVGATSSASCGSVLIDGIFLQHLKVQTLGL